MTLTLKRKDYEQEAYEQEVNEKINVGLLCIFAPTLLLFLTVVIELSLLPITFVGAVLWCFGVILILSVKNRD